MKGNGSLPLPPPHMPVSRDASFWRLIESEKVERRWKKLLLIGKDTMGFLQDGLSALEAVSFSYSMTFACSSARRILKESVCLKEYHPYHSYQIISHPLQAFTDGSP